MIKTKNKKIVALIPARGGSKGIPNKNIVDLRGKPLLAYNIEAAKNSRYVSEVYVSTNDQGIAEVAESFGAKVINRPAELASDTASSESALLHFAGLADFDILVFLQCTSPLTLAEDIDGALEKYLSGQVDSVLSVCNDHGGFLCGGFTWDEDGNSVNYDFRSRPRRQDRKKTYRENGAIYITGKSNLLETKNRLNGKVGIHVMPNSRSFELDDLEELELLRKIFHLIR